MDDNKVIVNFISDLISNSKDLDSEINKIIDEEFWNLI